MRQANPETEDYVSRLSAAKGELHGKKLITLPNALHRQMTEAAKTADIPMYQAYEQAARLWLKSKGLTGRLGGLEEVSGDEERFLRGLLDLYRNANNNRKYDEIRKVIETLVRLVQNPL